MNTGTGRRCGYEVASMRSKTRTGQRFAQAIVRGREGKRGYNRSPGIVSGFSSKVFTIEYAARSM
jgi:hypothetical protein